MRLLQYDRADVDLEMCRRSLLGCPGVYNLLPDEALDADSVSLFQAKLQGMVLDLARQGCADWHTLLSPRHPLHMHPLRSVA